MKAPLLLGNDLRQMENSTLEIISNSEVIALNQDPLGVQGYKRTSDKDGLEVWAGPLSKGHVAIVLFNRSSRPASITALWNDIGIAPASLYHVRDLWAHQDLGIEGASVTALVDSHDVVTLRLKPVF
jgi:alpha-galactosidase